MRFLVRALSAGTLAYAAAVAVGVVWWGRGDLETGGELA